MPKRRVQRLKERRSGTSILGFGLLALAVVLSLRSFYPADSSSVEIVTNNPVVGRFDTVAIPVPVEPIRAGTRLGDANFQVVRYPQHQVPEGAVLDVEQVKDGIALATLPAHLPVYQANISAKASVSNAVIDRIPEGMRAMTIRVDATSAVEGWASSGAIVDVLLVTKEGTSVVAEKVKILSAERSVSPIQAVSNPSVPSTVTLLVTQSQCLAINTAVPQGKIAFALRSLGDEGGWLERRLDTERFNGELRGKQKTTVHGVIRVEGEEGESFALSSDGRWIATEQVPEGFLISKKGK